ncbi:MAG TPA: type II toxin-antitoxin system PemK/MazF family toxin [Candidatus Paceibacterota bacterium]|nr:type II toxin-antitoxin system PemK/MazF family toxin [Candidatus Paceibacterota bacterium]
MPKRGDVVLIPFPFSDLSGQKVRPALILSKHSKHNDVVVLFITSKSRNRGDFIVAIAPSKENGLKVQSEVVCDKIATLDRKTIIGQIGHLESKAQKDVDKLVTKLLGL